MGDINPNCFVKWSVSGGTVAGKVSRVHNKPFTFNNTEVEATDEKQVAEILLPSDQTVVAECSALAAIDEVGYNAFVADFAAKLLKDSGASYMTDKEVQAMKDEMCSLKASLAEAKAAAEKASADAKAAAEANAAELAAVQAALSASKAEAEAAKAEVTKFTKEKIGLARFEQAVEANFVASFGDKPEDQKAALANLGEAEWGIALKVAGKLTQQTVTAKPKLTEQTVTSETKLTDAKASLDAAEVDKKGDAADVAAGLAPSSGGAPTALALAMSRAFDDKKTARNSKKVSK